MAPAGAEVTTRIKLERLNVGWFEMPIQTHNLSGYIQVVQALDVPIALDALANRFQARD